MTSSGDKGIGIKSWIAGQKPQHKAAESKLGPSVLDRHRIAVLPFSNISPDPRDEYFADGMTEELISTMSKIGGLKVIARTSIMGYKGGQKKISEIAEELGAGTIVEGSVRKVADRLRVTVQLIESQSSEHLWAESYDRELHDVFGVQSDIARRVAEALKVKLLANEESQIQKKPTTDTEAYLLYLKGRQQWNMRTETGLKRATEYFTQAIIRDPSFAPAFVGLADSYLSMSTGYISDAEAAEKARPAVIKALQIDERLAEAHASYGQILQSFDWKWDDAETEYKRAMESNPSYATAHQWYARLLRYEGRLEEALTEAKKALELDPLAPIMTYNLGAGFLALERYDEAIACYSRALEIQPDFPPSLFALAETSAMMGEFDEAMTYWKRAAETDRLDSARYIAGVALFQAAAGKRDEALRSLEAAKSLPDAGKITATSQALVFACLHDKDKVFEWLEKARMLHEDAVAYIKSIPLLKDLRTDPRFLELLRKMRLDKY